MNSTKLLKAGIAVSMIALAGCSGNGGGSAETETETIDAQEVYGCSAINIYNAGEYIDEDVVPNFKELYNAKVKYDTFESNEMLYTKLLGGNSYDVLVPSDYMIEQLMQEGLLQEVDMDAMTNIENLDPQVIEMQKVFDPDRAYAVPYFWGSVGLVYNTETVDPEKIEKLGWDILKDPEYKGRIFFYDSQRDGFMIAFKALGYSMNTDDPKEIQEAFEWLREMNATMDVSYVTDEVIDAMINSEKDIAVMYSGDAAYVLSENESMGWVEPYQGTNIWIDAMVIPANSTCPGLANEFINYIISEDVQNANSEFVGYTSVDTSVMKELSGNGGTYEGNPAYMPRMGYEKDEVFHYNAELKRQLSELWTQVKIK